MAEKEYLLTREGYEEMKAEYEQLISVTRKEVAERLRVARSFGDLSENAEYDAAKDEQAAMENRINELEQVLRAAKIIDESKRIGGRIEAGSRVTVQNVATGQEKTFSLVGSMEANPFEGKISNVSPVGAGLIGHKVGEEVEIEVPSGKITYKILSIGKR